MAIKNYSIIMFVGFFGYMTECTPHSQPPRSDAPTIPSSTSDHIDTMGANDHTTKQDIKEHTMPSHDNIAKAEKLIKDYLTQKYAWNESEYNISVKSEEPTQNIVEFMIRYKRDAERTPSPEGQPRVFRAGGGKSRVFRVDMKNMTVVRELGFQ